MEALRLRCADRSASDSLSLFIRVWRMHNSWCCRFQHRLFNRLTFPILASGVEVKEVWSAVVTSNIKRHTFFTDAIKIDARQDYRLGIKDRPRDITTIRADHRAAAVENKFA